MRIGMDDVRALEYHAEQVWDATYGLINAAHVAGATSEMIPPWSALTDEQKSAWIMSLAFDQMTSMLGALAARIARSTS